MTLMPSPSGGPITFAAPTFSVQRGSLVFFGGRSSLIGVSQATWALRVNAAPVVPAWSPVTTAEGAPLMVSATGLVDPDGDALTLSWSQVGGPAVTITNAASLAPTFTIPRVTSNQVAVMAVFASDGFERRDGGLSVLIADSINEPPTADAGPTRVVDAGQAVVIPAAGVDPNGEPVAFDWVQLSGPPVVSSMVANQVSFTAPAGPTSLRFQVTVTDSRMGTGAASVQIVVRGADAGTPMDAGAPPDAGASSDAGSSMSDAGTSTDAGASMSDAGSLPDAGASTVDGGAPAPDAGASPMDGGLGGDGGAAVTETGAPGEDAGVPDGRGPRGGPEQSFGVGFGCSSVALSPAVLALALGWRPRRRRSRFC
jgi:hypothetical protein